MDLASSCMAEGVAGLGGASGTRAAVGLKHDHVFVILTQSGSRNARPFTSGGYKLAMELMVQKTELTK